MYVLVHSVIDSMCVSYLQQTKSNTQDTAETSESEEEKEDEDGRGGRFRSERQTVTVSLKSSRTRDIPDTLGELQSLLTRTLGYYTRVKQPDGLYTNSKLTNVWSFQEM